MGAKKEIEDAPELPWSRCSSILGALSRFVCTLLALVLILGVSLFLFSRTEGFRSLVSDRIENTIGVQLEAEASRIAWSGEVIFEGVRSISGEDGREPGFTAGSVRFLADPLAVFRGDYVPALRSVRIDDWRLEFVMDEGGIWQPQGLAVFTGWVERWGSVALPHDEPAVTPDSARGPVGTTEAAVDPAPRMGLRNLARVRIRDGDMVWWASSERPLAEIRGMSFDLTPLDLPTGPGGHYHLWWDSFASADGAAVRKLDVELFQVGPSYLVINLEADETSPPESLSESTPKREEPAKPPASDDLREQIREELRGALEEG